MSHCGMVSESTDVDASSGDKDLCVDLCTRAGGIGGCRPFALVTFCGGTSQLMLIYAFDECFLCRMWNCRYMYVGEARWAGHYTL